MKWAGGGAASVATTAAASALPPPPPPPLPLGRRIAGGLPGTGSPAPRRCAAHAAHIVVSARTRKAKVVSMAPFGALPSPFAGASGSASASSREISAAVSAPGGCCAATAAPWFTSKTTSRKQVMKSGDAQREHDDMTEAREILVVCADPT
jgi:hypothetical protein